MLSHTACAHTWNKLLARQMLNALNVHLPSIILNHSLLTPLQNVCMYLLRVPVLLHQQVIYASDEQILIDWRTELRLRRDDDGCISPRLATSPDLVNSIKTQPCRKNHW